MIPIGARLAEMARIRLRYDEARRHVQSIQQVSLCIHHITQNTIHYISEGNQM